ncbi:unnamed protein product [Echinostoma caproni]|uniref:Rab-GAP TBC domain-containing protein n=1 Tax=Echinostoma caproni TaxID=27848 RepID=A0A3P8J3A7_9TREM|nr:unnamed protein product [Echinostoma caproni]
MRACPSYHQVSLDVNRLDSLMPPGIDDDEKDVIRQEMMQLVVSILLDNPSTHYYQGFHDICYIFLSVLGQSAARRALNKIIPLRLSTLPPPTSTSQPNFSTTNMGDKYAALAELDGMLKNANATTTSASSTVLSSNAVAPQSSLNSRGPMLWPETFTVPPNSFFNPPIPMAPISTQQLPPSAHNPFASPSMTSTGAPRHYSASNPFISNSPGSCVAGQMTPSFQPLVNPGVSLSQNSALFQTTQIGMSNPFRAPTTQLPGPGPIAWTSHLNSNPMGSTPVPPNVNYPMVSALDL